jgi:hypothetical protein
LAQIGSDTNWSQAAGGHLGFLLLKKDGSLWTWGTNGFDWSPFQGSVPNKLKSDLVTWPSRFSDDTNWTQLYSSEVSAYAMNNYGEVWSWLAWAGTNDVSQFTWGYTANGPWSNFTPGLSGDSYIGIKTNGELLVNERMPLPYRTWENQTLQLGAGEKWKSAVFDFNNVMAIRSDGTLWNFKFNPNGGMDGIRHDQFNLVQLDTHSDWVALLPGYQGVALASDGSLWACDRPSMHPWLAPSRKPAYMGNILQGAPAGP